MIERLAELSIAQQATMAVLLIVVCLLLAWSNRITGQQQEDDDQEPITQPTANEVELDIDPVAFWQK